MVNWHKLSERLPPMETERVNEFKDFEELGTVSLIKEQVSKPLLFRSPSFVKLCERENICFVGFKSDCLVGNVFIEHESKGKRVLLSLVGLDGFITISSGNKDDEDSCLFNDIFNGVNDIEWLDMDELSVL